MFQLTINTKDENNDEFNVIIKCGQTEIQFIYGSIFFLNLFGHEGYVYFDGWRVSLQTELS